MRSLEGRGLAAVSQSDSPPSPVNVPKNPRGVIGGLSGSDWTAMEKKLLGIIEKVVSTNRTSLAMLLPSLGNWLIIDT